MNEQEVQELVQGLLDRQQAGTHQASNHQVGNTANFPKLNGSNYQSWKEMIIIILQLRGLHKAITEEDVDPVTNLQAKLVLLETMDESHRSQVRGCPSAKEVMRRLEIVYADNSASNLHRLLTSYYRYMKDPRDSMSVHLGKMDDMRNTLRDLGIPVSDDRIHQATIIGSLPEEYSNMMEIWDLTHESMRTTANLISRLIKRESDLKMSGQDSFGALIMRRSGSNHRSNMQKRDSTTINELKRNTTCHKCGEKGHWHKECPQNKVHAHLSGSDTGSKPIEEREVSQKTAQHWNAIASLNISGKVTNPKLCAADSGATAHLWNDASAFSSLEIFATPIKCMIGDGNTMNLLGLGNVPILSIVDGITTQGMLNNVLYAPKLPINLFSIGAASENGIETVFINDKCKMKLNGQTILEGEKGDDKLFILNIQAKLNQEMSMVASKITSLTDYHKILGHASDERIKTFLRERELTIPTDKIDCADCPAGKAKHTVHPTIGVRAGGPGRIHLDLSGDENKFPSLEGFKNYMLCKDEFTGFCLVYFCKDKREVPSKIAKMLLDFERLSNFPVVEILSDNGSEFRNSVVELLLLKHHVRHSTSAPYCPQQNGRIEREMQTITNSARVMLIASSLPKALWPHAIETAVYLKNLLPTKSNKLSPIELLTNRRPPVNNLIEFGRQVHVIINDKYLTKWDARTRHGYFVGYTTKSNTYRVYVPTQNKIIESCDVVVAKHNAIIENKDQMLSNHAEEQIAHIRSNESLIPRDEQGIDLDWRTSTPMNQSDRDDLVTGHKLSRFFSEYLERDRAERVGNCETDPNLIQSRTPTPPPRLSSIGRQHLDTPRPSERDWETANLSEPPNLIEHAAVDETSEVLGTTSALTNDSTLLGERLTVYENRQLEPPVLDELSPPPELLPRDFMAVSNFAFLINGQVEPKTYQQAINSTEAESWKGAIERELSAHRECSTWTVVEKPQDRSRLSCKWVFTIKRDRKGNIENYKARMVARGFEQQPGIDFTQTFAPVAKMESIRALLAICAARRYHIAQFDVSTAFLHGQLDEEVYIDPPAGISLQENQCLKLNKALYGLKQAPRAWNSTFNKALMNMGFRPTVTDQCVYTHPNREVLMIIYVDDGLVMGPGEEECNEIINNLELNFRIKRLSGQCFVGFEIRKTQSSISLSQKRYISDVVSRFGLSNASGVSSPMVNLKDLLKIDENSTQTDKPYREAIGCLQYLACSTRPDILYAVNVLARYNDKAQSKHWTAVQRVIRYVKRTIDYHLQYGDSHEQIYAYSDADWGGDIESRVSISGVLVGFSQSPIIFASRKQSNIAQSSAEAEYISANEAAKEIAWLSMFLDELNIDHKIPKLYIDNQSTINQIYNNETKRSSKHVEIKFHYVRHQLAMCRFKIEYIESKNQIADLLTKPLSGPSLENLLHKGRVLRLEMNTHNNSSTGITSNKESSIVSKSRNSTMGKYHNLILTFLAMLSITSVQGSFEPTDNLLWRQVEEHQVSYGAKIFNFDVHLISICNFASMVYDNDYKLENTTYIKLRENCNKTYNELIRPALQELMVCLPTKINEPRRLKRAFDPVTWLAIGGATIAAAGGGGSAAYSWISSESSYNRLNKMDVNNTERDRRLAEVELALVSALSDARKAKDIRSELIDLANNHSIRIADNKLAIIHMAELTPDVAWNSASLHQKIVSDAEQLNLLATSCKKGKLNVKALLKLIKVHLLQELDEEDTHLESVSKIDASTFNLKFVVHVKAQDTRVWSAVPFRHFANYLDKPILLDYEGPKYIIHNATSQCTKGIGKPEHRLVLDSCLEEDYIDPELEKWEPVNGTSDHIELLTKPQVYLTSTESHIYCMRHKIHVFGKDRTCPTFAFKLPISVPFNLSTISHNVTFMTMTLREQLVNLTRTIHHNRSDDTFEQEGLAIEKLRLKNENSIEPGKLQITKSTLTIPLDDHSTLAIISLILLITICIFSCIIFICWQFCTRQRAHESGSHTQQVTINTGPSTSPSELDDTSSITDQLMRIRNEVLERSSKPFTRLNHLYPSINYSQCQQPIEPNYQVPKIKKKADSSLRGSVRFVSSSQLDSERVASVAPPLYDLAHEAVASRSDCEQV